MADLLIIDDDVDLAEALAELMSIEGHTVRIGYNGEEGLRLLEERVPDAVLMDIEMPVLDGPSTAYRMLLHDVGWERIPLVLLSGVPNLGELARRIGSPYFLSKPYPYDRLVGVVNKALAERVAPAHLDSEGRDPLPR